MKELRKVFIFTFLFVSFLLCSSPIFGQGFFVDITNIDTVRVRILADLPPKPIDVRAYGAALEFSTEKGFFTQLDTSEAPISIDLSNALRIEFSRRGGKKLFAQSLYIRPTDTARISLHHPEIERRYYLGTISIEKVDGKWTLINNVGIEDYVSSVTAGEMPFEHPEALKTQAIIARTYALWNLARAKLKSYDLDDHTGSQVYIGDPIFKPRFRKAAYSTMGEIVLWGGKIVFAAYFSTSGGTTTNNESVWRGAALPYLRSIQDGDASAQSPHYEWKFAVHKRDFARTFSTGNFVMPKIQEKDVSGRVTKISVAKSMKGQDFRLQMIRAFGALSLKSTMFDLKVEGDSLYFEGRGLGHGVGLSQWGAYGLAHSGWKASDIIKFYYKGVDIANYHALNSEKLYLAE